MRLTRQPRAVLAWAFYDWANSAFATIVMAGFFPVFFKQFWSTGVAATESTLRLGTVNSLASLVIVCLAPVLGAIADQAGRKKGFLLVFAALGILSTGALYLVAMGSWFAALLLYGLGLIGFTGGNIFYDALLLEVSDRRGYERVSSLGYALGYLGGGLLFAFSVLMTLYPGFFGLADASEAVRLSFLLVAGWWALFSLPVLLLVKETPARPVAGHWLMGGFRQLALTFGKLRQLRITLLFLLAYWCYIDGVNTIVLMAVDYGLSIGFAANNLMVALLITQFVGFPASLVFGRIGSTRGPKQGIMLAIFVYFMILLFAYRMDSIWEFYLLATAIGLVQGGIQALSRALYAHLTPRDQAGEFFGFYNMLGKFAVVLGPVLMGWIGVLSGDSRIAILSVSLLFLLGAVLLARVDVGRGQQAATALERT